MQHVVLFLFIEEKYMFSARSKKYISGMLLKGEKRCGQDQLEV